MTPCAIGECQADPEKLIDYGVDDLIEPPTWLLTLDRQGFLPLRVWKPPAASDQFEAGSKKSTFRFVPPPPPQIWTVVSGLTWLLIVAFVGTATYVSVDNQATFFPTLSWDNRPTGQGPDVQDGWRVPYGAALLLLPVTAALLLWPQFSAATVWAEWCGACVVLAGFLLGRMIGALIHNESPGPVWGVVAAVALPVAMGFWWHYSISDLYEQRDFFSSCSRTPRGSSPLWPVLAIILVLICFCYSQKTRIYLAIRQAPDMLPPPSIVSPQLAWANCHSNRCLAAAYRPWREGHGLPLVLCLGALAFVGALADVLTQLSTLDGLGFTTFLIVLESVVTLTLLLTCWQVLTLWNLLRHLLAALEPLPFVDAFVRPERTGDRRPIWVRWLHLESLDAFYRTALIYTT